MLSIRLPLLIVLLAVPGSDGFAEIIDFDDLSLDPESHWSGPDPDGETVDGQYGPVTVGSFESGGASFVNRYDPAFGGFWTGGFAYSNVTDNTTAGTTNQYSAFTGTGHGQGDDNYGVAFGYDAFKPNAVDADPFDPASAADLRALSSFTLPENSSIEGLLVTNATYPALSMLNGDAFSKKFGGDSGNDPDWFKLTAYGIDAFGVPLSSFVEFYLADFRYADNAFDYIITDWTPLDLTALAGARSLHFNLSSSDVGDSGMNTPAFFAVDDIQIAAVPEPAGLLLLGGTLLAGGVWGRFRGRSTAK